VEFRPEDYGPEVARILNLAGGGTRPMPLVRCGCLACDASDALKDADVSDAAVRAGLYVHCGCWDQAHELADSVQNPDGFFWHGIVHRPEPDAARCIVLVPHDRAASDLPELAEVAAKAGYGSGTQWTRSRSLSIAKKRDGVLDQPKKSRRAGTARRMAAAF